MIPSLYETFKHWSKNGSVYILSDTHFADEDCKLIDSNWISPEEQIKIINKMVSKSDTLILLGDVGSIEYAKQLRGYKVLIMGNHDESRSRFEDVFDEIYEGALFIGEKILLSHEPIFGLSFCMNIHGHDHSGKMRNDATHLNLAANVCGFRPISLGSEIKSGLLSGIKTIHRQTIDNAIERKTKN